MTPAKTETVQTSSGPVVVELCSVCGGRPASVARLFRKPNPERFCGCPFTKAEIRRG